MKLLHTADWHVGRTIRGRSRLDEHVAVLGEIVEIARRERVDLVAVVGDLFETASPPPEAEAVVYRTLLALAETGARVAVVAGNHDNARRLHAVAPVFESAGAIHLVTEPTRPDDGGLWRFTARRRRRRRRCVVAVRVPTRRGPGPRPHGRGGLRTCPGLRRPDASAGRGPHGGFRRRHRERRARPRLRGRRHPRGRRTRRSLHRRLRTQRADLPRDRGVRGPGARAPGAAHRRTRTHPLLRVAAGARLR